MKSIKDYTNVTDRLELKKDCFEEAINMMEKDTNRKRVFSKKNMIPVIAAVLVACGTMTAVFAEDIANVFRKAENAQQITATAANGEQHKVNKSDQLNYKELEKHSDIISEECETDGLKLKAESVFCDGENLAVTFTAENTNPDIPNDYHIWGKGMAVEINGKKYTEGSDYNIAWLDMVCDYEGAPTYTGTFQYHINEESRFTGNADVKLHIGLLDCAGAWENSGKTFNGSADFFVKVSADTSNVRMSSETVSDESVEVAEVKSTPYALSVKHKVVDSRNLVLMVYDENGNRLERNVVNQGEFDGEYNIENFSSTDSSKVTLKFVDKNSDDLEVVSEFEVELK